MLTLAARLGRGRERAPYQSMPKRWLSECPFEVVRRFCVYLLVEPNHQVRTVRFMHGPSCVRPLGKL